MRRLALHGSLRRWLTRIHRWSGLLVMVCLLVASATGVWLVFRAEIDRKVNSRLRVVTPAARRVSQDEIVSQVEAAFPGTTVSSVDFPARPDLAVTLYLNSNGMSHRSDQVFVNPYSGEILGDRQSATSLDSMILGLHYSLLMGGEGSWIMGIAAMIWLAANIIGLALSWPSAWRRIRSWRGILSARVSGGSYKVNYDLHRAGGVWLFPVLIVLAFTSVQLNLPQYIRPFVTTFSTLTGSPNGQPVSRNDAVVTFGQADAAIRGALPDARTTNIYRDLRNGRYSVYFHLPGDVNPQGDNFAFVDVRTAAVTGIKRPSLGTAGDRFMAWLYPLHTGAAFGWPGRLLVAAAGLVMIALNVTGLYVWWIKWLMRRRSHQRSRYILTS